MGTVSKITGVTATDVNKIDGVALTGVSKVAGQTVSLYSNTKSILFDGTDDYIDYGNPAALQVTGALTISAWVKFTGNIAPIVSKYESGSAARPKSFGLDGDRSGGNHSPVFFIYNSGTIYSTPTSIKRVDDGDWHHLLATFKPSTATSTVPL